MPEDDAGSSSAPGEDGAETGILVRRCWNHRRGRDIASGRRCRCRGDTSNTPDSRRTVHGERRRRFPRPRGIIRNARGIILSACGIVPSAWRSILSRCPHDPQRRGVYPGHGRVYSSRRGIFPNARGISPRSRGNDSGGPEVIGNVRLSAIGPVVLLAAAGCHVTSPLSTSRPSTRCTAAPDPAIAMSSEP